MIPEIPQLTLFVAAAAALLLIPGPAVMYIVARSVQEGRSAGIASTLGIATGSLVHVAAAALGLSSILVKSALAYGALKYLGAAYLVYLGVRKLLDRQPATAPAGTKGNPNGRAFRDGIVVNILNPKTALFFFAFLPQFVDVGRGAVAAQIFFLGMLFIAMGVVSDGVYALLAGSASGWIRRNPSVTSAQRYLSGGVFVALGLMTALSGSSKK